MQLYTYNNTHSYFMSGEELWVAPLMENSAPDFHAAVNAEDMEISAAEKEKIKTALERTPSFFNTGMSCQRVEF